MPYKIYHDPIHRLLVVEGTTETFPERSLVATISGSDILVKTYQTNGVVLGPVPFTDIHDKNGAGFATSGEALLYLQTEFNQLSSAPIGWAQSNW